MQSFETSRGEGCLVVKGVVCRRWMRECYVVDRVLCLEGELWRDGDVITVGDVVDRSAQLHEENFYGTELDAMFRWRLDEQADEEFGPTAKISGTVVAIEAVYVRLTALPSGSWHAASGSAWVEAVESTEDVHPQAAPTIDWGPLGTVSASGWASRAGFGGYREGEESLSGWIFTLRDALIQER